MKVILYTDVENLGEEGDICDVKDGFGRNYLFPKNLALPYNKANLALFEHKKEAIEKRKEEKRRDALSLKERIEAEPLVIKRPAGETGKLFGSVSAATLVEELEKRGIQVERKRIELQQHNIKMVGNYSARVKLYNDEAATLKFSVEKTESEEEEKGAEKKKEPEPVPEPMAENAVTPEEENTEPVPEPDAE